MTGAELRAQRENLGWSQAELARRAGITQPMVSVMETSPYQVIRSRYDTVLRVQQALYEGRVERGKKRLARDPDYQQDIGCDLDD
jgi:predicted transcriptional regulator